MPTDALQSPYRPGGHDFIPPYRDLSRSLSSYRLDVHLDAVAHGGHVPLAVLGRFDPTTRTIVRDDMPISYVHEPVPKDLLPNVEPTETGGCWTCYRRMMQPATWIDSRLCGSCEYSQAVLSRVLTPASVEESTALARVAPPTHCFANQLASYDGSHWTLRRFNEYFERKVYPHAVDGKPVMLSAYEVFDGCDERGTFDGMERFFDDLDILNMCDVFLDLVIYRIVTEPIKRYKFLEPIGRAVPWVNETLRDLGDHPLLAVYYSIEYQTGRERLWASRQAMYDARTA